MLEAQVALAEMLVNGRGGPRDHAEAQSLFERAAEHGHVGAMFALGAMFGGGHDVPWDRPAARKWFRGAAERGHGHAQLMLGRYLARALGGERDLAEAKIWLERALAQGLEEARADIAGLPAPENAPPAPASAMRAGADAGAH
jgi:TPR repeat protein